MLRTIKVLASLAAAVPLAVFIACSSSSSGSAGPPANCDIGGADGGECTPGTTPAYTSCLTGSDLQAPTVSFAQSVQPLFNSSCALSTPGTCHALQNAGTSTPWLVYLGAVTGTVDAGAVITGLVGKPAAENPGMSLIKAGDPDNSYLMHKLDYDQCQYSTACNAQVAVNPQFEACGQGMPYQSGILPETNRDDVRRWIAQGAKNN
jgi:hypothetical protein